IREVRAAVLPRLERAVTEVRVAGVREHVGVPERLEIAPARVEADAGAAVFPAVPRADLDGHRALHVVPRDGDRRGPHDPALGEVLYDLAKQLGALGRIAADCGGES